MALTCLPAASPNLDTFQLKLIVKNHEFRNFGYFKFLIISRFQREITASTHQLVSVLSASVNRNRHLDPSEPAKPTKQEAGRENV